MSASESGPPDTASATRSRRAKGANNSAACGRVSAAAAFKPDLTAEAFLLTLRVLFHSLRSGGIFAFDFAKRGAGGILLAQFLERLRKTQQRVGRFGGLAVARRHVEKGLRRLAILLTLKARFREPIKRFGREPIIRVALHESAERLI